MGRKNELMSSTELRTKIIKMGYFVKRYINGYYDEEFDLINPSLYCNNISSKLFPSEHKYKQTIIQEDSIIIIMQNGDIVELVRTGREYFNEESILNVAKKLLSGRYLLIEKRGIINNSVIEPRTIPYDEAILEIKKAFRWDEYYTENIDFLINTENKDLATIGFKAIDEGDSYWWINIYGLNNRQNLNLKDEENIKRPKIIQSNRFRTHMEVHKRDFIIPYYKLVQYALNKGYFDNLNTDFLAIIVEFPFNIGFSTLTQTKPGDEIVYGKRKNRDIYSRFTLNGKRKLINKSIFVLNRSYTKDNEYYLITMYPGEYLVKELDDPSIKDELERRKMFEFWSNHAIIFNPRDTDLETLTYRCPYNLDLIS